MPPQPLFAGLIVDEFDQPVGTATIGDEPCYVVDDTGFKRHIPSVQVDRQVLDIMLKQIKGNESLLTEQAAKMMGTEDIFSKAMLKNQLENLDKQFEAVLQAGIPEDARAFMGMSGFKVVINVHGEVVKFEQPTATDEGGDGGE